MAKKLYIVLFLVAHYSVTSQTYNFQWVNEIDGSGNEKCYNIDYDTVNESVYVVGSHTSNLSANYAGVTNTSGLSNGFLTKFNSNGVYQWGVSSSGIGTCVYNNLKADENGNIYISGVFENAITINGTTGSSISLTSAGDEDTFLAKFTDNGEILWVKHLSGNEDIGIRDIAITSTGIVFVGDHDGPFSLVGSGVTVSHNSQLDCFALKLDNNGNFLWRRSLSGDQDDRATSVTSLGNAVFVTGIFNSSTTNYTSGVSAIGSDGFIVKLNTFNGNIEAEQIVTGTNDDGIRSVTCDSSGVYIGGHFDDNFSLSATAATFASNTSVFVSKLDLNLNPLWDSFAYASLDNPNTTIESICLDSTGNLFAIGNSRGNLSFNTGAISGTGNLETFVFSLKASNGNYLFGQKVNGPPVNYGYGIACNPFLNELFCTGTFTNTIDFSPITSLNASQDGGYVVKLACNQGSLAFEPATNFCSTTNNELVIFNSGNAPFTYTVFDGTNSYPINSSSVSDTIVFTATTDRTFSIHNFKADGCISLPPTPITLSAALPIGNNFITSNQLACSNEIPNLLSGTTPTGGSSFDTFLWLESTDNINYTAAIGINNQASYQPPALNTSHWYKRVVVNQGCGNDTSNFVKIDVFQPIDNNIISTAQTTICSNNTALLTGTNPTGGNNTFNYQWQESVDNAIWTDISGATFASYTTPNLTSPIYYRRLAVTPFGCSDDSLYSNPLYIQQYALPYASFDITEDTLCSGDNVSLEITGAGNQFPLNVSYTMGGTNNTLSFPSSSITFNLGTVSTTTLTIDSLTDNNGCVSNYSDFFNIVVYDPVDNNNVSAPSNTCLNDNYIIQGTAPSGGNGIYTYFWEESTDELTWTPAQGNNSTADYANNGISNSLYYRRWVVATEGCEQDSLLSTSVQINFVPIPSLSFLINDSICDGEEVTLTTLNADGIFPVSIFYSDGTNEDSFELTTNNQPTIFSPTNSLTLSIDSLIYNNCTALIDTNFSIEVFDIPIVNLGNDMNVCGENAEVFPSTTSGNGTLTSSTLVNLPVNAPFIITANNFGTHELIWTVNNVICSAADTLSIQFFEPPQINTVLANYDIGIEDSVTVYINSNYTTDYAWFIDNGNAVISFSDETKAFVENIASESVELVYEINNGICPTASEKINIERANIKIPTGFSPNNDGKNDTFIIEGLLTDNYALTIFDKYGRTVFESSLSTEGFTGLDANGNELPEDTYYYILSFTFKGEQYDKQSFLLLKR